MKTLKLGLLSLLLGFTTVVSAQKITVLEGNLSSLKGQKIINVEYDWSNSKIGKYSNEQEYIDKKSKEYNEKEAGKGTKWAESWKGDKAGRFEPEFEKLFNKYTGKTGLYLGNEKAGKYTAIVKTTFIEPGFNVYVTKKPASVDLEITIVETDNKDKVICKIVSKGNPGRTMGLNDMDTGIRISESYALAGKKLGAYIAKAIAK